MFLPRRIQRQSGRYSRVDDIPYALPVNSKGAPALMAAFTVDARRVANLLPGNELHPLRVSRERSVLLISVIDYKDTDIGAYIEFSIGLACTHGRRPAPPLLPLLFPKHFGVGQYVVDLPVNTEVSVKGGKGIWGMPKHLARLDFRMENGSVSSRYEEGGQQAVRVRIERPKRAWLPLRAAAVNYCAFRGMLMKSSLYFRGRFGFRFGRRAWSTLELGDHPRVQALRDLSIARRAFFTGFFPASYGVLDDHFEAWFLTQPTLPAATYPEGLESVVDLGQGQTPMPPPESDGMRTGGLQEVRP
ncbi:MULTISPECIES: acetoacetate decarboxylase family protein [Corallococcus]|uniref:acetoacetate decarboxylase family protein n=1 Tax=Corallococcus TaxID=83461 RepID=UPI00117FCBE0|nr:MULTISPECIES: acetoacetate decarboxylase family protein [Corallococcus]NBD11264.1 acetoacetate decarboxylase [Corallococcus silvisoli]TSC26551.1 acetoacetate decarboxylase [Corallococcus sp. Z5C101001]